MRWIYLFVAFCGIGDFSCWNYRCMLIKLGERVLVISRKSYRYTCLNEMPDTLALHLCLGLSNLFASLGKRSIRREYERAAGRI